jgi:hypothetical protein
MALDHGLEGEENSLKDTETGPGNKTVNFAGIGQ